MPKIAKADIDNCAQAILALDLERADRLETIATQWGLRAQVQEEIEHLRDPNRLADRTAQLSRNWTLIAVEDIPELIAEAKKAGRSPVVDPVDIPPPPPPVDPPITPPV